VRALRWEPHLPAAITEERLAALALQVTDVARVPAGAAEELGREAAALLGSGDPADASLGLVRAACGLCAAYRGASLLGCNLASATSSSHIRAHCPVRLSGRLTFAGSHAEAAVCWARAPGPEGACAGGRVTFAVLSPTAASLTGVVLTKGCGRGSSCAGLECGAVEPLGLDAPRGGVALEPGRPHDVVLEASEHGTELSVGGLRVSDAFPCTGELHFWCVHWPQDGSVGVHLELAEDTVSGCTMDIRRARKGGASRAVQERLAEGLATLCLGGPLCNGDPGAELTASAQSRPPRPVLLHI